MRAIPTGRRDPRPSPPPEPFGPAPAAHGFAPEHPVPPATPARLGPGPFAVTVDGPLDRSTAARGRRAAPHRGRRLALAGGLVLLLAVGAITIGYVVTSGGPLAILDLNGSPLVTIAGTAGLLPGGQGMPASLLVTGPALPSPITISSIDPQQVSLPLACPPEAWQITPASPARLTAPLRDPQAAPGEVTTHLAVTVALAADAPAACQGAAVPVLTAAITAEGRGGTDVYLRSSLQTPLTVATLGTPGVAVEQRADQTVVITTPDAESSSLTRYLVESSDGQGGWTVSCQLVQPVACASGHRPGESRQYRVTAFLGAFWRRTSATVTS